MSRCIYKFLALFILLNLALYIFNDIHTLINALTASTISYTFNLAGLSTFLDVDCLHCAFFSVVITNDCNGLFELTMVAAAIMCSRHTVLKKACLIIGGAGTIFLISLVRISSILLAGTHSYSLAHFMHEYLWTILYIMLLFTAWLLWFRHLNMNVATNT